jgi:hypothetical protein
MMRSCMAEPTYLCSAPLISVDATSNACSSSNPIRRSRFVSSFVLIVTPNRWNGVVARYGRSCDLRRRAKHDHSRRGRAVPHLRQSVQRRVRRPIRIHCGISPTCRHQGVSGAVWLSGSVAICHMAGGQSRLRATGGSGACRTAPDSRRFARDVTPLGRSDRNRERQSRLDSPIYRSSPQADPSGLDEARR